jgi:hypothetical protein
MEILRWNYYIASAAVAVAWIVWFSRDQKAQPIWRRRVTGVGIGAVSANAAMFWWAATIGTDFLLFRDRIEPLIYTLLVIAFLCAIGGKGTSRGLVALCAFLGFFLWVVPGIL